MIVNAVVVTYNRKKLLNECLDSILNQSFKITNIIVIDNCSTDGTDELVRYKFKGNVKYYKLNRNYGGAGGFFYGIQQSFKTNKDARVWIMDDDTIPDKDCLKKIVENNFFKKNYDNCSYFASLVKGIDDVPMNVPTLSKRRHENGYLLWQNNLNENVVEIETATFVSLLLNPKAINRCGLPFKDFFLWCDDTEYTLRLTKFFGPAYLVGNSVALHKRFNAKNIDIKSETNKKRIKLYKYFYRNTLVVYKTYFSKFEFFKCMIAIQVLSLIVLFGNNNRFVKFLTIQQGFWEFIFKRYNNKAFVKRFNNISEKLEIF